MLSVSSLRSCVILAATVVLAFGTAGCGGGRAVNGPGRAAIGPALPPATPPGAHAGASTTSPQADGAIPATLARSAPEGDHRAGRFPRRGGVAIETFGRPADASNAAAIASVVRSYLAALAAHEGARACAVISSSVQSVIAREVARPGPLRGKTCAAAVSVTFKRLTEPASGLFKVLSVREVRVRGADGYALIRTKATPSEDSVIPVQRKNGVWKIDASFPVPVGIAAPTF